MSTTKVIPHLRLCAVRSARPRISFVRTTYAITPTRHNTNGPGKLTKAPKGDPVGPNMGQEDHVSEEAAKMAKIQGREGPDLEAGTPVHEIMAEDKEFAKDAPKVLKEDMAKGKHAPQASADTAVSGGVGSGGKRSFSTFTRQRLPDLQSMSTTSSSAAPLDPSLLPTTSSPKSTIHSTTPSSGLKFPLPTAPILHKSTRHPAIITQFTNLLMRDGKKSAAEKLTAAILTTLRTSPTPTYSPTRPLLPGAPPASHLPLNPIAYLTLAVDSVAPLLRIQSLRGAAGGGAALQIPAPLGLRQRRRQAMTWIIDAAEKKGGVATLAQRIAGELVGVMEGRSAVWERRSAVHKLATTSRSNLKLGGRRR